MTDANMALRAADLAKASFPRDEVQRIAQIVLSVIRHPDQLETIDWQIARALVAEFQLRPEDGSIAALQARADGNAVTCRQLMNALLAIRLITAEAKTLEIADDAIKMKWLMT